MKIAATNNDLILVEYPFLKRYVVGNLDDIKVCRIDLDLLRSIPYTEERWLHDNHRGLYPRLSMAIILMEGDGIDAKEIACVSPHDFKRKGEFSPLSPSTWIRLEVKGEQVGEAIEKLNAVDKITYVIKVVFQPKQLAWVSYDNTTITLYKLPREQSLRDHVSSLQATFNNEITQ